MSDLESSLRDLLVIPSVSGEEDAIADYVVARLATKSDWRVDRVGNTVIAHRDGGPGPRLLLCGHLDTVPGDQGVDEDTDCFYGLGVCDMKGGLAVMLSLADRPCALPMTMVFYPCEEVAFERNGLHLLGPAEAMVADHDLAVLLEPTDGVVELGCQGSLRLRLELAGRRAHTSRPWMGVNAIDRVGELLARATDFERRRPLLAGVHFQESLSPTRVESFVANNVVPDRARLWLNYRFAPDLSGEQALEQLSVWLRPVLGDDDLLEAEEIAEGAAPVQKGFEALIESAGQVRAKLGWTDVSFVSSLGVPSVNFGPGDPLLAHGGNERLEKAKLHSSLETLASWIDSVAASV